MAQLSRDARRARLAEVVWAIIREDGISAVSVRSVASRAGIAVGSLRHLFPTQTELLEFSAELMLRHATERIQAVPREGDPLEVACTIIDQLLPITDDVRAEFEVNLALIAEAPAYPGVRRLRDQTHQALLELTSAVAQWLDPAATETDGRRLLALTDGLALQLLHDETIADQARYLIRTELQSIADRGAARRGS
ncbi:TetR family transcriptional regulator [Branchiibius hedensis]|uniref:Regulatory protein, tetR family n=1 Tax=Branchiibius hedensis TaxID=672460 RepID=A0A2Y9BUM5_9MICO|nr:TetR/AcrR family transcriptional regulator [Branchiibius hedensis]PWJ27151.1 TetR family transcriptional regulator [Branchiibius hedensis]SSA35962.1 regulatory protein, tetR family [Branchiibius hedensis]